MLDPKLTTNNAKPVIKVEDKIYKLGEDVDFMSGVKQWMPKQHDLTSAIKIVSNNYEEGKIGRFEVVYRVTDSDSNTVDKKSYVTVYEDFIVNKSKFGQFDGLNEYNEEFKIPVASVTNNGGNYPHSFIDYAIDGNPNTHWETNRQNSDTFKNEIIFDLGESKEISRVAYKLEMAAKDLLENLKYILLMKQKEMTLY